MEVRRVLFRSDLGRTNIPGSFPRRRRAFPRRKGEPTQRGHGVPKLAPQHLGRQQSVLTPKGRREPSGVRETPSHSELGDRRRSEERSVGKECVSRVDLGGGRIITKTTQT